MTARKPIVLATSGQQEQVQSGDPLLLQASVAGGASLRIPHGAAPSAPINGDLWTTSSGLFVRINGVTYGPLGSTSGGGGGNWSLAQTWTYSTNVANVSFTGLSGSDILIVARGITCSASTNLSMTVSTNNGSSYWNASGNYVSITPTTGVESNAAQAGSFWASFATAARSGTLRITAANVTGAPRIITNPDNGASNYRMFLADLSNPINAVQVFPLSGNITGGSIYIFTR